MNAGIWNRLTAAVFVLALVVGTTCGLTACAGPVGPSVRPSAGSASSGDPGVTKVAGGKSRVFGVLLHRDIEGGVWVIVKSLPVALKGQKGLAPEVMRSEVLAVVTNPELFDLASLENKYVEAVGTIDSHAVSTNMAGPQMQANTVKAAAILEH
jgi:hypothetical protein